MTIFTWNNVGGDPAGAGQAAANIQNTAADRIEKGAQALIDITKNSQEKQLSDFKTIGEQNLQSEIAKVQNIDNVDDLQNLDLNTEGLKKKFGAQFGKDGQGISRLQGAVDNQLTRLTSQAKQVDEHTDLLDDRAIDDAFGVFSEEHGGKSIRDQIKAVDSFADGKDLPPRAREEFNARLRVLDENQAALTFEEAQDKQANQLFAARRSEAARGELAKAAATFEPYANSNTPIDGSIVNNISKWFNSDDNGNLSLEFEAGAFALGDVVGSEDPGAVQDHIVKTGETIQDYFGGDNKATGKLTNAVIAGLRSSEDSPRNQELIALLKADAKAGKGLILSDSLMSRILSSENFWNDDLIGFGGEQNSKDFEKNFQKALEDPDSHLFQAFLAEYINQTEGQLAEQGLKKATEAKIKADANAIGTGHNPRTGQNFVTFKASK